MEKEFVPYELALRMKALGFDGPCFAGFNPTPFDYDDVENLIYPTIHLEFEGVDIIYNDFQSEEPNIWTIDSDVILAPTWQQAFRWFREKYELHSCIHSDYTWNISGGIWDLNEYKGSRYDWDYSNNYLTYEEAELSCLKKLIEIVEKNWLKQHN
jgi:hypothetical protein